MVDTVKIWGVKEFSKLTGVTARTLQYYDKENILKPHSKDDNGHRYYSLDNFYTLQQINVLKYAGFDLKNIKFLLSTSEFNLQTSLQLQLDIINDNIAQLNKGLLIVEESIKQLNESSIVNWQLINKTLDTFKISHTDVTRNWATRNFSGAERKFFGSKIFQKTKIDYEQLWAKLFQESTEKMLQGKDVRSDEVQDLARRWIELWFKYSKEQYPDNPELANKMWDTMKSDEVPDGLIDGYQHKMILFMNEAMEIYESEHMETVINFVS